MKSPGRGRMVLVVAVIWPALLFGALLLAMAWTVARLALRRRP